MAPRVEPACRPRRPQAASTLSARTCHARSHRPIQVEAAIVRAPMLLHATHRRDGTAVVEADVEVTPFLGFIEIPQAGHEDSNGHPILRVEGWLASREGRSPARLRLRAGQEALVELTPSRERPDVVEALEPEFPVASTRCGFIAHVELPPVSGSQLVPVAIEVLDDDFSYRGTLTVRHTDAAPLQRADYASTWEREAVDEELAKVAVLGEGSEEYYASTARDTVAILRRTVGIEPTDDVLEIGCGVGRVGAALAPLCHRWIGADVSANMLGHARRRLHDLPNVELVQVNGWDLHQIPDVSVDVAYSTIVFMHLDEWERYAYVREARRVLRPGGRCYVDNIDLNSKLGWELFEELAERHHPLERPPNISKTSTVEELQTYLQRAGFEHVETETASEDLYARAWGRAPSA